MQRAQLHPELASRPRLWSHDLLRAPTMWRPCHDDRSWDDSRANSFELPHFHLIHGPGRLQLRAPEARDLGQWRYGIKGTFRTSYERHPDAETDTALLHRTLVALDGSRRALAVNAAGGRTLSRKKAARFRELEQAAAEKLEAFLVEGLGWREGRLLRGDEERVWMHLRARGLVVGDHTVCEQCGIVFTGTRRARFCGYCRRHRVRISTRPVYSGGWHTDVRVGGRWATGERDLAVHYTGRCTDCGAAYQAGDPKQRLCRNCGGGAGRLRRRRRSVSRTGRQCFRYEHVDGAQDFSLSLHYDGRTVSFHSSHGVLETDDAEIALLLDHNDSVRHCRPG